MHASFTANKHGVQKEWFLLEKYQSYPPLFLYDFVISRSRDFNALNGIFLDSALLYKDGNAFMCLEKKSYLQNKQKLLRHILRDPAFLEQRYAHTAFLLQQWERSANRMKSGMQKDPASLVPQVKDLFERLDSIALVGQVMNIIEFDEAWFSGYLKQYLQKRSPGMQPHMVEERFHDLTNPFQRNVSKHAKGLDAKHRRLFKLARTSVLSKKVRYEKLLRHNALLVQLAHTFGKKCQIPQRTLLAMSQAGFLDVMSGNKKMISTMDPKDSGIIVVRGKVYVLDKRQRAILHETIREKTLHTVRELQGQCAMPGSATGIAVRIDAVRDMKKMKKGYIIVSHTTTTDIVPAVKKAAAIVTDMGGITSHAAIVSRELRIPCVIGTKFATQVLRDGDRVEVDATKGIVRKL